MPQIAVVILLFTIVGFVDVRTTLKGYRQFKREGGLGQLCGPKRTEVVRRQTTAPGVDTEEGTEVAKDEEEGPDLPFPLAPKGDSALSFLVSDDGDYGQGSGSSSSRGRPASYAAAKEPGEEAEKDEDEEAAAARACSALLERERRTALWKPALLTLCFAGVLVLESVANKGLAGPRCFNGWWLTTMAVIPWALSFVVSVRRYLLWDTQVKVRKEKEKEYRPQSDECRPSQANAHTTRVCPIQTSRWRWASRSNMGTPSGLATAPCFSRPSASVQACWPASLASAAASSSKYVAPGLFLFVLHQIL